MLALDPDREPTLRALLAASPMPMLVGSVGPDLRLLAINQRLSGLLGYRWEDLHAGDAWWALACPDPGERSRLQAAWRAAIDAAQFGQPGLEPIAARVTCRDGTVRDVEFHLGLYTGYALVVCNDVTARRRAEAELMEARGFLQRVVDTSPSLIFVVDETGRAIFVNRSMADYYQSTPELMLSKATQDLHANQGQAEGFVQDDLEVIRTGKELVKEELNTAPDGRVHWFHTVKVPLVRPDGRVQCLGIATDITARKHAEDARRELEAQAWRSQKLESLGVLAGGIAHDFNNLLTSIRTDAHHAEARLPPSSPVRPFLQGINRATQRAAELTQEMLAYVGRGQAPSVKTLCLNEVVAEMKALLDAVVSKKASFRLELAPAGVEADPAQLHQVIMNLMVNASDALGAGSGEIVVRTGWREFRRDELHSVFLEETPPAGRYSFLEVEDEGCGMEPETLARIFEPFFSTKFTGRGLGLSAVLGIVRAHGGTIQVTSQPGRGTRLMVLLPQASAPEPVLAEVSPPLRPFAARGTLLVVDDEELVRATVCIALEDAGFRVLSAADGQEGVELFERHAAEICVVVLDLTMPRLDGWQCLQQLRAIRADIPVLIMSGYAAERSMPAAVVPAPLFVRKPFEPDELVAKCLILNQGALTQHQCG